MSRMSAKALRFAVTGVLAAGLLAGCAGSKHMARAGDHAVRTAAKQDRAVGAAEAVVAASPNDAAARLALGQTYLEAGRFQSAATSFSDAIALGDTSGRTQLSLALAKIASGEGRSAVAVLDGARDSIAAGDRGLAMALAGETTRGVGILLDALRAGENSPKLRQNLAFAYALDGQWREARISMAQDVPADQIDDRISAWAMMSQPEAVERRVASLLGVPMGVADAGQPQALALGGGVQDARLAAVETAAPTTAGELPAIDEAPVAAAAPAPAPVPVVAEIAPVPAPVSTPFSTAFAAPEAPVHAAPAARPGFVSQPLVHAVPSRALRVAPVAARPVRSQLARTGGTHLVQLGSFSSEANARRAVGTFARRPELRGLNLTITPAVVNGKNFWRVAAAGLDGGSALRLCSGVKNRGGACFAYAATNAPTGARPAFALAGGLGRARR